MNLYYIRCLKITDNVGNSFRIIYDLGVKPYCYCSECGFLKQGSVNYEDLGCLLEYIDDIKKIIFFVDIEIMINITKETYERNVPETIKIRLRNGEIVL